MKLAGATRNGHWLTQQVRQHFGGLSDVEHQTNAEERLLLVRIPDSKIFDEHNLAGLGDPQVDPKSIKPALKKKATAFKNACGCTTYVHKQSVLKKMLQDAQADFEKAMNEDLEGSEEERDVNGFETKAAMVSD